MRSLHLIIASIAVSLLLVPQAGVAFTSTTAVDARGGIPNYAQVTPAIFRGGRPSFQDLRFLQNSGVRTIINLENDDRAVRTELDNARRLGLNEITIPLEYLSAPSDQDIQRILSILQDPSVGPIFLHCKHGEDRTGMVMGLYRVFVQKWTPQNAYREMLQMGFHPNLKALDDYFRAKTGLR